VTSLPFFSAELQAKIDGLEAEIVQVKNANPERINNPGHVTLIASIRNQIASLEARMSQGEPYIQNEVPASINIF
jgi:hypothetical protein